MGDVAKEGRTILFVSHNMNAISMLCPQAILLEAGQVAACGPTHSVVAQYLASSAGQAAERQWEMHNSPGGQWARLLAVRALNADDTVAYDFDIDKPVTLEMEYAILRPTRMTPSFHLYNQQGIMLFGLSNLHDAEWGSHEYAPGVYRCACVIPGNYLNEGQHYVTIYLNRDNNAGLVEVHQGDVVSFRVNETGHSRGDYMHKWGGLVRPVLPWTTRRLTAVVPDVQVIQL
jgi:lipopolysaccharide transport system ATP-binding protein